MLPAWILYLLAMYMPMSARYTRIGFTLFLYYLIVELDLFTLDIFKQKRVFNGRPDPCGAVHITIGDGGNREGLAHK